jgi:hypothetical protein
MTGFLRSAAAALIVMGVAPACVPSELTYGPESRKDGSPSNPRDSATDDFRKPSTGGFAMRDGHSTGGMNEGGTGGMTASDSGDATVEHAVIPTHATDATDATDELDEPCPKSTRGPSIVLIQSAFAYYCIDSTEVTNGDYRAFLTDVRTQPPTQDAWCTWNTDFEPFSAADGSTTGAPEEPVRGVDWCDAYAYCNWAGKHLCGLIGGGPNQYQNFTRADTSEWFNACSDYGALEYPYGTTYDARACAGADSPRGLGAVGTLPMCKTPTGAFDLSGNVWEWEDSCTAATGASDTCRARGGSYETGAALLSCDGDSALPRSTVDATLGFRCCSANYVPH